MKRTEIGVVAQDDEQVFPEAVMTDSSGPGSVAHGNLVAPFIEAVRTLDAERRVQDEKTAALEGRLARMEEALAC